MSSVYFKLKHLSLADTMNQPSHRSYSRQGFSLLELMAVVTIIGILVVIVITRIVDSTDAAKEKTCYHNRSQINSALERFAVTTGNLPTAISDVGTIEYFPGGIPICEVTGSAYSLNTTTHHVDGHTNSSNH